MATESTEPIERWTAKRRVALVLSVLKGEYRKKVSVWAQGPSATLVSWSIQEPRSCTWPDINA